MRDDGFDAGVVVVGCALGAREQDLVVEDVEPLVLHRAEIEGGDGDDHEDVEIVFAAIDLFVPAHRAFERIHRIERPLLVAVLDIDAQIDSTAGHRIEAVADMAEIARDQREQIGRFRERIAPDRKVPSIVQLTGFDQVAVRQQHGRDRYVRFDPRLKAGKIVGAVDEIGDAAKALRFALRAIDAARHVEAFERGVLGGRDLSDDLERKGCGRAVQRQRRLVGAVSR